MKCLRSAVPAQFALDPLAGEYGRRARGQSIIMLDVINVLRYYLS